MTITFKGGSANLEDLTEETKSSLMKVGKFASGKIGAVLAQYFNFQETLVNIGFEMTSTDSTGKIVNVYAQATKSGIYFRVNPDDVGKDLVITMIPPSDHIEVARVSKFFQQKDANGFIQKQNDQLN